MLHESEEIEVAAEKGDASSQYERRHLPNSVIWTDKAGEAYQSEPKRIELMHAEPGIETVRANGIAHDFGQGMATHGSQGNGECGEKCAEYQRPTGWVHRQLGFKFKMELL